MICLTIGSIWPWSLPTVTTSTPTITWLFVSVANCTLYAGLNPPLAIFITVASGSVVEHRALSFSPGFFFASISGSRSRAAWTRAARSSAARRRALLLTVVGGLGVVLPFPTQRLDLRAGLGQ